MPRTRQPATFRPYRDRAERRSPRRHRRAQLHPLLNLQLSSEPNLRWSDLLGGLPQLTGRPICVRDRARLKAHRGKLLWGYPEHGIPVYAACFLPQRQIVLQTELLAQPPRFRLILVHELFHFVWTRLGNRRRAEFSGVLAREQRARARGELGESSNLKKERLETTDCLQNSRAWRDYVCESFCDTAAWLYSGTRRDAAFTLAPRWRDRRAQWFNAAFEAGCKC